MFFYLDFLSITLTYRFHPPWLLPEKARVQYRDAHNNLKRLLGLQSKNKWVTLFIYDHKLRRWAQNSIYSFLQYGHARNYLAAAIDEASLQDCIQLRLPCYNATHHFQGDASTTAAESTISSLDTFRHHQIVWGKVSLLHEILGRGFHVHMSDVDVVYLREVYKSWGFILNTYKVDMTFMKEGHLPATAPGTSSTKKRRKQQHGSGVLMLEGQSETSVGAALRRLQEQNVLENDSRNDSDDSIIEEEQPLPKGPVKLINTGVFAMKSTNGSLALVRAWLDGKRADATDQEVLNEQVFRTYAVGVWHLHRPAEQHVHCR